MPQAPADSLRPLLDSVFAAPKYHWVVRPHPWRWLGEQLLRFIAWFQELQFSHPLAYYGIVAVAVVVLVAIFVHAGFIMSRAIRGTVAPDAQLVRGRAERRDGAWYRAEAMRQAAAGRFPAAMRAWFEGVILDLAGLGVVRWHPSKTPREYAREARLAPPARVRLVAVVDGLYASSFAGAETGPAEWEHWRRLASGGWDAE